MTSGGTQALGLTVRSCLPERPAMFSEVTISGGVACEVDIKDVPPFDMGGRLTGRSPVFSAIILFINCFTWNIGGRGDDKHLSR